MILIMNCWYLYLIVKFFNLFFFIIFVIVEYLIKFMVVMVIFEIIDGSVFGISILVIIWKGEVFIVWAVLIILWFIFFKVVFVILFIKGIAVIDKGIIAVVVLMDFLIINWVKGISIIKRIIKGIEWKMLIMVFIILFKMLFWSIWFLFVIKRRILSGILKIVVKSVEIIIIYMVCYVEINNNWKVLDIINYFYFKF